MLSLLAVAGVATPASANTDSTDAPIEPATVGFRIANADGDTAGSCLTNNSGYTFMLPCDNGPLQDWVFVNSGLHPQVRNYGAGGCLDSFGVAIGGLVEIDICANVSSQRWQLSSGNWFELKNVATGTCLDVRGFGTGTVVQLWTCTGGGNQRWKLY